MLKRVPATQLELLFSDERGAGAQRTLLVPELVGARGRGFGHVLMESVRSGVRRVVPAPAQSDPTASTRAWHEDLWLAMKADDRSSLLLVTGPSAAHLAPILGSRACTIAFVREPVQAVSSVGPDGALKKQLSVLESDPSQARLERLVEWANPQSRALLAVGDERDRLPVSLGPGEDAARWRQHLFHDVLPQVRLVGDGSAPQVIRELARNLGARPKRAARAASALVQARAEGRSRAADEGLSDQIRALSWLDVELYKRATMPES